jgi:hypothetical protein
MLRFVWHLLVIALVVGFVATVGLHTAVHDAVAWSKDLWQFAVHLAHSAAAHAHTPGSSS